MPGPWAGQGPLRGHSTARTRGENLGTLLAKPSPIKANRVFRKSQVLRTPPQLHPQQLPADRNPGIDSLGAGKPKLQRAAAGHKGADRPQPATKTSQRPFPAERRQHFPVPGSEILPGNTSQCCAAEGTPPPAPARNGALQVTLRLQSAELVLQVTGAEAGPPSLS